MTYNKETVDVLKINKTVEETVERIKQVFQEMGASILFTINFQESLKKKTKTDIGECIEVGFCFPPVALKWAQIHKSLMSFLPGRVTVYAENNETFVSFLNLKPIVELIGNEELINMVKNRDMSAFVEKLQN
ncbi:hypothetical protein M0813_29149 [Anaeramoeba flamelloides]|uniref:DUF302 domain-containing protein n=1 Tax=Anaeramoeba flamelloides TaxID=1746091 RepID=A0AAV7Y7J6_9EUKA|nr:hypothetical protein M0812_30019 [Anaeramoeba flamelloides]KAJ6234558.1 hypothetical protein M0813_29149 [Anaeramoeba flamelloides]